VIHECVSTTCRRLKITHAFNRNISLALQKQATFRFQAKLEDGSIEVYSAVDGRSFSMAPADSASISSGY
jgi:hypothetical protein